MDEYNDILKKVKDAQKINENSVSKLSNETKEILRRLAEIDVLKVEINSLHDKVTILEKNKNWLYRSLIGAIFLAILGIVMQFKTTVITVQTQKEFNQNIDKLNKKIKNVDKQVKEVDQELDEKIDEIEGVGKIQKKNEKK